MTVHGGCWEEDSGDRLVRLQTVMLEVVVTTVVAKYFCCGNLANFGLSVSDPGEDHRIHNKTKQPKVAWWAVISKP